MNEASGRRRGVLSGFAAYVLWGLFPLYFHGLDAASAVEVIAHRIVWTFVLMVGVVTLGRSWPRVALLLTDRRRRARTWIAGGLLSLNWLIYVWAVLHDAVIDASLGYFITPLATVTLGVVVLKETLSRLQIVAVGFGAVAVIVLVVGYGSVPWISLGLAATFSSYSLLKKTVDVDPVTSLLSETAVLVPIAIGALLWFAADGTLALGAVDRGLDVRLIGLGVVTSTPLLLFGAAARRLPLVLIGLLQYVTPWAILLLGWLYYGEEMSTPRWIGFSFIWVALACLTLDGLRGALRTPDSAAHPATVDLDPISPEVRGRPAARRPSE